MIFLFKDHTYDVVDPAIDEMKIPKKIEKVKDRLTAVLFEFNTRLHSDTFVIITEDHLKTEIEPFFLTYSISIVGDDLPIDYVNTVTRTIHVEDILSFYQIGSLIYQLEYSNDAGDSISLGETRVILSALSIREHEDSESIVWDPDGESAKEFINRQGIFCDTDTFLCTDAAYDRQKAIEDGCYITRCGHFDDLLHLEFHFHGKRNILWLKHGEWFIFQNEHIPTMDFQHFLNDRDDHSDYGIFGLCINQTSLVYLADFNTFQNYREMDQCTLVAKRGSWGHIYTDREAKLKSYREDASDAYDHVRNLDAFNMPDMLYMATYLPQYWDLERFLFHIEPLELEIEVLQRKRYYKSARFTVPVVKDGEGLILDLFTIFAMVMKLPARLAKQTEEPPVPIDLELFLSGGDTDGEKEDESHS